MAAKLVDTNWILRYLLRDDEKLFALASALLEKVKTGEERVLLLESVLTECIYVLDKIYKVERLSLAEIIRDLLSYKGVANPDRKDMIDAVLLYGKTNLSIVDCLLCAKSRNHKMPLYTFDKELNRTLQSKREPAKG